MTTEGKWLELLFRKTLEWEKQEAAQRMRIAKYVQGIIRAPLYRLEHWGRDKLVTGLLLFLSAPTQQFSGLFTLKYVKCLLFTLTPEDQQCSPASRIPQTPFTLVC